ncbi:hypothetical protein BBFGKLBO_00369 [Synechococcus sp. CBW1107]|nr:hypothetical protein BBFGKLBO_00369 [Synechococcus sp. CBW1107]
MDLDHPIFSESVRRIRQWLGPTDLDPVQQEVLERLVHSSGDLTIAADLRFSADACAIGLAALAGGAVILTDTAMAAAAVSPMARRTFANPVRSILEWAPDAAPPGGTRSAEGLEAALAACPGAVVLIGSAPTALERLLDQPRGPSRPALVIGMPVGFVGVAESKRRLAASDLTQIRLDGSRGGAGLVGATCNALLRRAWLEASPPPPGTLLPAVGPELPDGRPLPRVPVSVGELIDKLTILAIKRERIQEPERSCLVRAELDQLEAVARQMGLRADHGVLAELGRRLEGVNRELWDVEEAIRAQERAGCFDATFIALARSVYRLNDERAALKRRISEWSGSALVEVKSYG